MKKEIVEAFREELKQFDEATRMFYTGQMLRQKYKGISGSFGSYAERNGKYGMLRLRMTAGRMTKEQLGFIVDMIKRYELTTVKLTTGETIQLHHLKGRQILAIANEALEYHIYCRGGGGDNPRNVIAPPLSGVLPGETFDVLPYAEAVGEYLLSILRDIKLPRKLKVGFANHRQNTAHATIRDLGFVAREDGTFDVYSAGGMGPSPRMGILMESGVSGTELLYYTRAMVNTFMKYGNYSQRAKARTRYMPEALGGADAYRAAFAEQLEAVKQEGGLDLSVCAQEVTKAGDGSTIQDRRVIAQKQPGLFAVWYHPLGGMPSVETLKALYDTIREMDAVELRLGADNTMYIIHCTAQEAKEVLRVTEDGANTLFETSVCCVGAEICQQGVRDSQRLYRICVEAARSANIPDGVLPQIHISGCPSSCGTHQVGSLGFRGGVKMVDGKPLPAYMLYVGGSAELEQERFGESWGAILENQIPLFLMDLAKEVTRECERYDEWIPNHMEDLRALAQPYLD